MQPLIKLTDKLTEVEEAATKKAKQLQTLFGQESKHSDTKVLKVLGDNSMVNLDGSRYLTEINAQTQELIDDDGHTYNYDVIPLEDLCQILDNQETLYT